MQLDQYYTKPEIATHCYEMLIETLQDIGVNTNDLHFIEPSAGTGSFYNLLPEGRRTGYDIDPKHPEVIKTDFFHVVPDFDTENKVVVGNPPYGRQNIKTIQFFNHAVCLADTIAFIVLSGMRSYNYQRRLDNRMSLVYSSEELPPNAFYTVGGKDYAANTIFQIWYKYHSVCLRAEPFLYHHPDFIIKSVRFYDEKYKDTDLSQIWREYDILIESGTYKLPFIIYYPPDPPPVWKFFGIKCKNKVVLNQVLSLDFDAISKKAVGGHYHINIHNIIKRYTEKYN